MTCKHCKERTASRPRGLCYRCWLDPAIRHRHPSTSKYGLWADGEVYAGQPTNEPPLEPRASGMLLIIGTTADGERVVLDQTSRPRKAERRRSRFDMYCKQYVSVVIEQEECR